MTRTRKIGLYVLALFCAVCLGVGLASCGGKDTTPTYGYGEEGTYYYTASDGTEFILSLQKGTAIQSYDGGGSTASYAYDADEGLFVFTEDGEDMATGSLSEAGLTVTYNGRSYLFLTYEYYTVSFMDGSTTIATQSVLNGKAASDPGEPGKEGYVFLGWYADSAFTERYGFDTAVTSDTTIYARFVELTGTTEYTVTYDFGNGESYTEETLNGRIYDLPEAEMTGYTFLGWWVSATNSADELTYRYSGEAFDEDTTLFAFWVEDGASYVGASVYDDRVTWENYSAAVTEIILRDENGFRVESFAIQSTDQSYAYDFASLPTGKYILTIQGGGVDETLIYVSNGLYRASGFTVISGSILMYSPVENAERYYITIECGNPSHDHTYVDNGSSLYYDFSSCEMPAEGITFTVYAYAEGYYYSVSSYNYFLGLERAEVTVEGSLITWTPVPYAMGYEVYIDGTLVATTSDTSYSLSGYGTGAYEIAVRPVTTGYYSEMSETITFTKTTLAAPNVTGIENYVVSWTEVEGAAGYKISIGGVETTVEEGITSLYLTEDNYIEGLDSYEIAVKALAPDSANDSPYGETITVTGNSVGSTVSYNDGTVTWQYSLSASEYRITVNDGDELVITGTNSADITLTKSGNNEITIYFVNDYNEIYGTASITVYAYAIVFDARGGTAYMDGEAVDTIYVAKGDTVTLPEFSYGAATADFLGWYTLPDVTDDPDAVIYQGDGYLFEDGTVFTGNSTIVLYAAWVNPRMIVSLDPAGGTLTDEEGEDILFTEISLNGRNYSVAVPVAGDPQYAFYGWYSGENGTGTRYTDENGNAYAPFSDETVTTLYACWIQVLNLATTSHNGEPVFTVSAGPDIGLVEEVTVPGSFYEAGYEYTSGIINDTAFSSLTALKTINVPDTMTYIDIKNNGYDAATGAFEGTALENVNVYATGEPSTTKEVTYYSDDGVLFRVNPYNGDVELFYYPYGRTAATYTVPGYVLNENEYELSGRIEVPVVRYVNALGAYVFGGHDELRYMTVPENVTRIGEHCFDGCSCLAYVEFCAEIDALSDYAFYGCTALESIDVPEGVKDIGDYAFYGCTALAGFTVPDGAETIGSYVFYGCTALTEISIAYGVVSIGDRSFYGCTELRSVVLPDSVEEMGTYLFYGCTLLESATLSSGCAVVGAYSFYQCYALRGIEIPYGVAEIGDRAFYGCYGLAAAVLPDSLETIGNYAFYGCYCLTDVTLPDSVTSLGTYVFDGCVQLETVRLSAGLTAIGGYDFQDCISLKSVEIPSGVTSIGDYAFDGCVVLASVSLPSGLTSIGKYAFRNCTSLTVLTIPSSVNSIGDYAFQYCYKLVEINNESSRSITAGDSSFTSNGGAGAYALYVYKSSSGSTRMSEDDEGYRFYVDGSTKHLVGYTGTASVITLPQTTEAGAYDIYRYAFAENQAIAEVEIPDGVSSIGEGAFFDCMSLVKVSLGRDVSSIGSDAFSYCYKLAEIDNRSSLALTAGSSGYGGVAYYAKSIYTTEGGSRLADVDGFRFVYDDDGEWYLMGYYGDSTDITLPDGIEGHDYAVADYAFCQNFKLRSVTIPGSVTAIGDYAFYECQNLRNLTLSEGLKTLGAYSVGDCFQLKSVTVPDSVTEIGNFAFAWDYTLERVHIGDGVVSIGQRAFYACYVMKELYIGKSVESIGMYCFYKCSSLKSVVLPESCTSIGTYCFSYCSALESVGLGSITAVSSYAFSYCDALKSVTIPDTCTSVGTYGFYKSYGIETLTLGSSLTEIGNNAFYQIAIKTLTIPASVESIGSSAFCYCESLETVTFEQGALTTISGSAFNKCTSLRRIEIPEGVTKLSGSTFRYDTSLEEVILPESLTSMSTYEFSGCTALETIVIPDAVTSIGNYCFDGCTILTDITLPASLTSIGTYCFRDCTALETIVIPDGVASIGNYCFDGCTELRDVTLPDNCTSIGTYVFRNCTSLVSLVIPSGVTSIGNYAFYGCTELSAVYFAGDETAWDKVSVGSNNSPLTDADVYFYSETDPAADGNFWHYDDEGNPVAW